VCRTMDQSVCFAAGQLLAAVCCWLGVWQWTRQPMHAAHSRRCAGQPVTARDEACGLLCIPFQAWIHATW
jgi:hypothetical protein